MKTKAIVGLLLGAVLSTACDESSEWVVPPLEGTGLEATGPSAVAIADVDVLQRVAPVDTGVSVTKAIGPDGGTIHLRAAGFKMIFPEGAVVPPAGAQAVEITVTALPGKDVAYSFEPHGLQFARPVQIQQDARQTTAGRFSPHHIAQAAHFQDPSALSGQGSAAVTEFRTTAFNRRGSKFRWTVEHFSGYLLATGRR